MKNRVLIVIDMQKGFNLSESTELAYQKIESLLKLNIFDLVVFTKYYNYKDSPICKFMNWNSLMDEKEIELDDRAKYKKQLVCLKNKYSCYSEEFVRNIEKEIGEKLEEVFICGVDLECCVLASATDLFENGIRPIVLTHYSGSSSNELYFSNGIYALHHLVGRNNLCNRVIDNRDELSEVLLECDNVSGNYDSVYLQEKVINLLIEKKMSISFAESCTGGLCAARLVQIANASKVFNSSFVTYSNESKEKYVSVKHETLEKHGAVSEEVALEMAKGCALANGANVGIGISGIAGPGGGTDKKPVGMVCYGFYIDGKMYSFTNYYGNPGRNIVRELSVSFVYSKLLELLK